MRQRLLDIDDRLSELSYFQRRFPRCWQDFLDMYAMSWIYHDNILDGMALTPEEIEEALASDITRDISLVSIYRRIRNYQHAIDWVKAHATQRKLVYEQEMFKQLHELLVAGMETNAGRYRHNSPVHRAYFQDICPPGRVSYHLGQIVEQLNRFESGSSQHPLEHVAQMHFKFMHAYPFSSWSGAVGRLLGNLVLLRAKYIPLVIHSHDRQKYYQAVAQAPEALTRLYAETAENNLDNAFYHYVESHCRPATSIG